jgi:hypothetical protein
LRHKNQNAWQHACQEGTLRATFMKKILPFLFAIICANQIHGTTRVIDVTTGVSGGSVLPLYSYDPKWSVIAPNGTNNGIYTVGTNNGLYSLPTSGCGTWVGPSTMAPGTYTYVMKFTGQPCTQQVTSAVLNMNYVGADNQITAVMLNGQSLGWSSIMNDFNAPLTQNVSLSIPLTALNSGSNTLQFVVYNVPDGNIQGGETPTALLVCGAITLNYSTGLTISPSVSSSSSTFCQGAPLTFNGSVGYANVTNHYWEMVQTDQYGNVLSPGYSFSSWYPGVPTGTYTFPASASITCGSFYRIKLAVQNACIGWEESVEFIYVECNPVVTITGSNAICAGTTLTLCENYAPSANYSVHWNVSKFLGNTGQCIFSTPNTTTTYSATVTSAEGCVGSASQTVVVSPNVPSFNLGDVTTNPAYYNLSALANNPATTNNPSYHYMYIVEELSSTGSTLWIETNNPPYWWSFPAPTTFNDLNCTLGYSGTVNLPTTYGVYPAGMFLYNHTYRITLGSWNSVCSWNQSSQIITVGLPHHANGESSSVFIRDDNSAPDRSYLMEQHTMETGIENPASRVLQQQLYPNPSDGIVNLLLNTSGPAEVTVYNMLGAEVMHLNRVGDESMVLDLSSFGKGIFLVRVQVEGQTNTQKVVVK